MAKTVISIIGKQGTGKSTIGKKLAGNLKTSHIETSDIVSNLHKGIPKKELTTTRAKTKEDPDWLGKALFEWITGMLGAYETDVVVLTGVREVEVHRYLKRRQFKIIPVEIIADPWVRYMRLVQLETIRSAEHFLDQDLAERRMGLDEVIGEAKYQIETSNNTSPGKLARALLVKLSKEGYSVR